MSYPQVDAEPYIRIRSVGGAWTHAGSAACALGHRIPAAAKGDDDGVFAEWTWDGAQLRAHNDRFGFLPLYYFEHGAEIGISTSILRLLSIGAPADLDYPALAVYLRFGCFLAADTAFRSIRVLPPGGVLRWQDGRLEVTGGLGVLAPDRVSRRAAVEAYMHTFRAAILRRLCSEDFAIPLSGGRDSRHILFELCAAGRRPVFCLTARYFPPGDGGASEIGVASAVASSVGVPHVVVEQPADQWEAERRCNAETDFCSGDVEWMPALADYLRGRVRWIYDGIGGDVLSAGLFLTPKRLELFRAGRLRELTDDLFDAEPEQTMLAPGVRSALCREVAVRRFVEELERHSGAPNPVGSFIFWNRTRRKIAMSPYRVLNRTAGVLAPYLDHEVFDLLSSLPAEHFLDHSFHSETIARAHPEYADLPYSSKQAAGGAASGNAPVRRLAWRLALNAAQHGRSNLVQRRYFLPRLLRCALDRRYSHSIGWIGQYMIYLLQLDETARSANRVSAALRAEPATT